MHKPRNGAVSVNRLARLALLGAVVIVAWGLAAPMSSASVSTLYFGPDSNAKMVVDATGSYEWSVDFLGNGTHWQTALEGNPSLAGHNTNIDPNSIRWFGFLVGSGSNGATGIPTDTSFGWNGMGHQLKWERAGSGDNYYAKDNPTTGRIFDGTATSPPPETYAFHLGWDYLDAAGAKQNYTGWITGSAPGLPAIALVGVAPLVGAWIRRRKR